MAGRLRDYSSAETLRLMPLDLQPGRRLDSGQTLQETSESQTSRLLANQDTTDVEDAPKDTERGPIAGFPLRRFWLRTFVLILVPPIITGYFFAIWLIFLNDDSPTNYRPFQVNEMLIFYSWMVISVFALDMSRHGLEGAEAAMLQRPLWQAKSAMVVLMHSGDTWSGPGGWWKALRRMCPWKRRVTGRLWWLLAAISIMPFVAFPLAGLSIEPADGYFPSSNPTIVIGRTWANFNRRQWKETITRGPEIWKMGPPVTIPGFGIAYTPPYLRRDEDRYAGFLSKLPNSLPLDHGVPELFLAPQATTPVDGKAWGLRVSYNCSIVKSAAEFTILNSKSTSWVRNSHARNFSQPTGLGSSEYGFEGITLENSNGQIKVFAAQSSNLFGYAEMGFDNIESGGSLYYNESISWKRDPLLFNPDGTLPPDTLEYALWQASRKPSYGGAKEYRFETSVEPSLTDMSHPLVRLANGTYTLNQTFFHVRNVSNPDSHVSFLPSEQTFSWSILESANFLTPPIGVRCRRASDVGTAEIDARTGTFSSFKLENPPWNFDISESMVHRFGISTNAILNGRYIGIFSSVNSHLPITTSNTVFFTSFVTPRHLLTSILKAHGIDALMLMYDGSASMDGAHIDPNLTSSEPGRLIQRGVISPAIPAAFLALWTLGSVILGLWYGFRRRWSETLDGYSFFRFGADFADKIRGRPEFSTTQPFEKCEKLRELPGLVGDSRIKFDVGHIGLVKKGDFARPDKRYD